MNHESPTTPDDNTDLDAARRDVARAEARLSNRWRAAKVAGEKSVGRVLSVARPVIIGVAVVGGVAWLVSRLMGGPRPRRRYAAPPATGPSLAGEIARAAAIALASTAARRLAERYFMVPGSSEAGRLPRNLSAKGAG
jgi:hypothetical protein